MSSNFNHFQFLITNKKEKYSVLNIFNFKLKIKYFIKSIILKKKIKIIIFIIFSFFLFFFNNINKKRFFFFYDKEKYYNNYSLFIYDYIYDSPKPSVGNIGDYIQSLAALQYFPKNCSLNFVDRDNIEFYHGPKSKIIMNGWYNIRKGNRFISKNLSPIYISYHISNLQNIDSYTINNLKKYQPIGCRDTNTQKYLQNLGINSYFSSCLTTTLDIDFSVNDSERTNEIIFIDFKFGIFPEADNFIKSLKAYDFNNITFIQHNFSLSIPHRKRFKLAKRLLEKYARAKLVISTRIHGSLPCLAFNTPNIFVNKGYHRRFPGIYELLNTIGNNSKGVFEINVILNNKSLVMNPNKYLKYAKKLKEDVKKFINNIP